MKKGLKAAALLGAALLLISATGCNKLKARDQLNKGVAAYKNAHYEAAIEHFKNAVALDPSLQNAKLYLATAYAQLGRPAEGLNCLRSSRQLGNGIARLSCIGCEAIC